MRIERHFTKAGQSPYAEIEFVKVTSEIRNPDGSVVFRAADLRAALGYLAAMAQPGRTSIGAVVITPDLWVTLAAGIPGADTPTTSNPANVS